MDPAFLVTDYAERGERFLRALADSSLGPARAAYWFRPPPDPYDEAGEPGDWEFRVVPATDANWQTDPSRFAEVHELVHRGMTQPRLGSYFPTCPAENDPVARGVLNLSLGGDRPRWITAAELGVGDQVGGVYVYPNLLLRVSQNAPECGAEDRLSRHADGSVDGDPAAHANSDLAVA